MFGFAENAYGFEIFMHIKRLQVDRRASKAPAFLVAFSARAPGASIRQSQYWLEKPRSAEVGYADRAGATFWVQDCLFASLLWESWRLRV
jgi:hypothetical protein